MPEGKHSKEKLTGKRKKEILEAAARVFARKGFHKATMKEIAQEAGIAPGTIYLYFRNKQDLLVSLPRLVAEPVADEIGKLGDEWLFSEEALKKVVKRQMERVLKHIDLFRVLFSSLPALDDATQAEYLRRSPFFLAKEIEAQIRRGIELGILRPVNPAIAARLFTGMFFSVILAQELLPGREVAPLDYDDVADEAVSIFLHGVLAHRGEEG